MKDFRKNKRGISEIVSYVLLIVIALSIAAGVFAYLRFLIPTGTEVKCADDVALVINDYQCNDSILSLTIANKGRFNADGFRIRASDDAAKIPTVMLQTADDILKHSSLPGVYYFGAPFASGEITTANFSYGDLAEIRAIEIQPFVKDESEILLCSNIADITLENC